MNPAAVFSCRTRFSKRTISTVVFPSPPNPQGTLEPVGKSQILVMYRKLLREVDQTYTTVNGNKFFRNVVRSEFQKNKDVKDRNLTANVEDLLKMIPIVRKMEMARRAKQSERDARSRTVERDAARVGFKLPDTKSLLEEIDRRIEEDEKK
eukprot:TRINITY_DN885_c0_g1_i4.p1 TRINITY_DN885_c0_g1~~TRINITY_DN885_c0_g1_i4.p1  ORF type:complete len:166 (-),score=43.11 TRINITY_DN885_c0_g1_i4:513-965(-)